MNLADVVSIITEGNLDKLKSTLEVSKCAYFVNDALCSTANKETTQSKDIKEYNPQQHLVHDTTERPDKIIRKEGGGIEKVVKVARLSIPEQKKIVLMASTFLGSPELSATPKEGIETELYSLIQTISEDNKLDYKFRDISKRTMSERECAELWYTQPAETDYWEGTPLQGNKFKLRMRVLSPSLGDTLYPVYDEYGDMVAFGRYFETSQSVLGDSATTENTCHFDVYTATQWYFSTKINKDAAWTTVNQTPVIAKIPVIYYCQPATEWADVQEMIDRLEKKLSNHADTNDYFDSPIVVASGDIDGFTDKGEQGKLLTAKNGATVDYLTWDNAPESMKMEIDNLVKNIHSYTHTPDISFDNMKTIGTFSGIALKMFFMDAHLKAGDKEELFGQGVQRRINYLKASIAVLAPKYKAAARLIIRPEFTFFLPKDEAGEVGTIVAAYNAGVLSLESAVKLNPLVENAIEELERIKTEQSAKEAAAQKNAIELAATVHKSTGPINQPLPEIL